LNRILKFEKSTKILEDIIKCQISPHIKTGLGYGKSHMNTKDDSKDIEPLKKVNERKYKIYGDVLKSAISNEDSMKRENDVP
jgi:hypothetical protein